MAFRTRRQQRYVKLRESGFLPFEARELSKTPSNVPYFKEVVKDRKKMLGQAQKDKLSTKQWEEKIKKEYKDKGFVKVTKGAWWQYDPWTMFREYEDRYKEKQPEYTSPWKKRRKDFQDFLAKYEAAKR